MMKKSILFGLTAMSFAMGAEKLSYPIVDSGQVLCFDNSNVTEAPKSGEAFYGQDAQHDRNLPSYTDLGNGCVRDNVTGLIWEKAFRVISFFQAVEEAKNCTTGGYDDWRMPTIKEVYSLASFDGCDVSPGSAGEGKDIPYINSEYFDFAYAANGNRMIDTQMISCNVYEGLGMGAVTAFGFNLADGRIKSYPLFRNGQENAYTVRYVRGNAYGINDFSDNGDGSITDKATGLTWSQTDSGKDMNWEDALAYVQELNAQNYLGHNDWRMPNVKELNSIVDYERSPKSTQSPAINPMFKCTITKNEAGEDDAPYYWTSTTHQCTTVRGNAAGGWACYIPFGESMGTCGRGADNWVDVHGAGGQRSDPKAGERNSYPNGHGPQGDAVRGFNFVRVVRG